MRLISLGCTWVLGIYLASRFDLPIVFALLALIPLALAFYLRRDRQTRLWVVLCLFALVGGILRFQQTVPIVNEDVVQFYNDHGATVVRGMVRDDPETGGHSTRFTLTVQEIKADGEWREVSGKVLVYAPRFSHLAQSRDFPYYRYGDLLAVRGELQGRPEQPSSEWPEELDYWDYLAHHNIYSVVYYPDVELIAEGQGFKPVGWLYDFRHRLSQSLASALPEPHGSLSRGLLLGIRGDIPDSLLMDFSKTGTGHIMAISGLHISIIAGILLSVGVWLLGRQRWFYLLLPLCAVWIYTLLSGMHPSALRAAIMASLFLTAEGVGRQRNAPTALVFAAAVMVGIHPNILWDVSFQLSFLAMAGLILLTPLFQSWARRGIAAVSGEGRGTGVAIAVADTFAVSLGAVLATLPLIAYNFHLISLTTLPATFLILPALPAIIIISFVVAIVGIFALPVACVLGWIAWLFLSYLLLVVEGFAALPFVSIPIDAVGASVVWGYYIVLALIIWLVSSRKRLGSIISRIGEVLRRTGTAISSLAAGGAPWKWLMTSLAVVAALVWTAGLTMPGDELRVSALDVGQGDAILIQKGHWQILVDGGPDPEKICLELGEEMPFWDRSIDLLILTHPQDDHVVGLVEVLRRYKVEQVLEPGFEYGIPTYEEWLKLIEEKDVERTIAQAGQRIDMGEGVIMEVLHPQEEFLMGTDSDVNNSSVVLRLVEGNVSFLLTGDIEEEVERKLLHRNGRGLDSTVLKVAHHGSDSSTSEKFLDAVNPQVAVISVGADNWFGHPDAEVMERLEERMGENNIYLTSEHGTVTFITDGEKLWVEMEK